MSSTQSLRQFKRWHLFISVLTLSMLFAALRVGVALQGMFVLAVCVALGSLGLFGYFRLTHRGRRRARISITIVSTLIGISPFFVAYGFILPGGSKPIPKIKFVVVEWLLIPFYLVGECVLMIADECFSVFVGLVPIVHFGGEGPGTVRPDAVSFIWLAIAASFGSSLLIEELRKRSGRPSKRDQRAQTEEFI